MFSIFKKSIRRQGFTLPEMLVSIGILIALITVVMLNQSKYTEGINLSSLADDISLKLFEAQAYGLGVREFGPGSGDFTASYGLSFSMESGEGTSYISFADLDEDLRYDGNWGCAHAECLGKTNIGYGNFVKEICALISSGGPQCGSPRKVDISFTRPTSEANLVFLNSGGNPLPVPNAIGASVTLESPKGEQAVITVYNSGQISVTYP